LSPAGWAVRIHFRPAPGLLPENGARVQGRDLASRLLTGGGTPMANRHLGRPWRVVLVVVLAGIFSGAALAARPLRADKLEKLDTSLQWIPEDVAFYSSMLRNRRQIEAIAGSRAWARLKAMPVVEMGLLLFKMQAAAPGGPAAQIEATLESPDVRQLLDMLGDMFSDEVFICSDRQCTDLVGLLQQIAGAVRYGPAVLQLGGQAKDIDPPRLQAMMLLAALCENLELLEIPATLVGFKLSDTDRAAAQLAKLETIANVVCDGNPLLEGRFKRTKLGKYEYLTLSLDGKMVPWDQVPLEELKELEANPGDVDKLVAKAKQMRLVIALGLRNDYLLLSIGPSTDFLARLGEGKPLVGLPEFKPLEPFADKPLTSVGYLSKALNAKISGAKKDIDQLLGAVDELLPLAELDADQKSEIRKDAAALAEDLKRLVPEPGPVTAFSFLTDQGIESYTYNWGEHPWLDGSKPLGLLEHVGGHPLLAVVWREKNAPENYDLVVKWAGVAYRYFEKYAVPQMSSADRKKYRRFAELVAPLPGRLDKANRTMLLPALADGQGALVLDAKLQSKHFVQALPATEKPMPMLEPALVLGVSNAELLRKALAEYREIVNGVLDALREIAPDEIPRGIRIPDAEVLKTGEGVVYWYRLPEEWGVDEKIAPNVGLSETVAVLSISPEHTKRLLAASSLQVGCLLGASNRPLAVAVSFDWAAVVEAITPWVDLATEAILRQQFGDPDSDQSKEQMTAVRDQVHTVLEVLKVFRNVTSESYFDRGALVSHTLVEIRDID